MIYVIIKESGSYSDYGKEIVCAYTHKPTAEAKLTELEGIQKRGNEAYQEYHSLREQSNEQHQPPVSPNISGGNYWNTPEWQAHAKGYKEWQQMIAALLLTERKRLASKYNLSVEDVEYGHYYDLSLEEVEGY
jgi:hypothetical protein